MSSVLDQWFSEKSVSQVTSFVDSHCYFIYAHWALQIRRVVLRLKVSPQVGVRRPNSDSVTMQVWSCAPAL